MTKDKDCPKKTFALIAHGDKIDKCFNVAYLISGATKEEILSDSKASYLVYMRMCIAHTLQNTLLDATIGAVLTLK